jgi:succinate dehydrogenase/fumarate reductase-like Fe-S protein
MTLTASLLVRRGGPGDPASHDRYAVVFEPGQSVLDGLRLIRSTSDPTLSFRFACLNANACKECLMLLDGKVIYACTAKLEGREMRLDPLPNKPLLRDLATAIAPPDERLPAE